MNIDCMTCLVNLARGCPTNRLTQPTGLATCAQVRTVTHEVLPSVANLPAHLMTFDTVMMQWVSFEGGIVRLVSREQI